MLPPKYLKWKAVLPQHERFVQLKFVSQSELNQKIAKEQVIEEACNQAGIAYKSNRRSFETKLREEQEILAKGQELLKAFLAYRDRLQRINDFEADNDQVE